VIPVAAFAELDTVLPVAEALQAGGLPVVEVTFRTPVAAAAVRALAADGRMLVGAGTIVRPDQVDLALDAGAQFIVSPGFSSQVVERCQAVGVPVLPGVATATDVMAALDHGIDLVKLFPAEPGGLDLLRALRGPFPDVRFVPTGGVNSGNAAEYLSFSSVAAIGGSWMVAPELVAARDVEAITRLTAEAVRIAEEAT
jgi:2-dehydro-3-deoxyphosphogluconate aldolase / (4S)-4-hydroxy-2-oxoglutarate aldolase